MSSCYLTGLSVRSYSTLNCIFLERSFVTSVAVFWDVCFYTWFNTYMYIFNLATVGPWCLTRSETPLPIQNPGYISIYSMKYSEQHKEIVDIRLRPQRWPWWVTLTIRPTGVAFAWQRTGLCRSNMTLSTKPEVHNVLHCRQRSTEPRPRLTRTENFVKFFHIC